MTFSAILVHAGTLVQDAPDAGDEDADEDYDPVAAAAAAAARAASADPDHIVLIQNMVSAGRFCGVLPLSAA